MEEARIIGTEADGREALLAEETGWERKTAKEQIKELKDVKREGRVMVFEADISEDKWREKVRGAKRSVISQNHILTRNLGIISLKSEKVIITYTLKFL